VEVRDILIGNTFELTNLHGVGQILLDCHLVVTIELHQHNMDQINQDQDVNSVALYFIADHEIGLDTHVNDE